ncbi:MAG: alpha/beta hydrolase family protein, partial [Pirellula sp.]
MKKRIHPGPSSLTKSAGSHATLGNPNRFRVAAASLVAGLSSLVCLPATSWSTEPTVASPATESKYAIKDLDGHFPFAVPETKEAWETRAKELRQQMLVSLGMYPMPTLAPVKPVVHSRREMDGYAIEKVYFESLPGFFVTGSLYTPTNPLAEGQKRPAVLCPHGHWANGRFYYTSDAEMKRELASGAERFESAARSPLQARCVQLARMGIVVFHYDMMGNADNQQISAERVHGFGNPKISNPDVAPGKWLLYSPTAEGLLQNIMGMQTINSIQSLEFLLQRADVDPKRISITGASGGGTQTFIASAIEPRFAGAYPVVMVSTSMQGGCTCENAVGLRVNTGNVELAALTAPRPLGVNAANDWTKDMAKDGYPELKKLYGLYGVPDAVTFHNAVHFPHNYNHVTRVPMYGFMNRMFGLGMEEPILEKDFQVLKSADMTVWDDQHPKPQGGIDFEADLLDRWAKDVESKVAASPEIRQTGWKSILGPANNVAKTLSVSDAKSQDDVLTIRVLNADGTNVGVLKTRSGLGTPGLKIRLLGDINSSDLPKQGEAILAIDDAWGINLGASEQSLVKNPRPAACYTY